MGTNQELWLEGGNGDPLHALQISISLLPSSRKEAKSPEGGLCQDGKST